MFVSQNILSDPSVKAFNSDQVLHGCLHLRFRSSLAIKKKKLKALKLKTRNKKRKVYFIVITTPLSDFQRTGKI